MEQTIVPEMLNSRWTHAARFASFLQPKLARIADIVHPMLHPSIINRQIGSPIKPSLARSMMIPTVAELLCRIAVSFVVGVIVSLILASPDTVLDGLLMSIHQVFRITKFESPAFLSL